MKNYSTENIRNIALISHSSAGKTSLAEAMYYNTGAVTRLGRVEDGNTVSDFDSEETKRTISINTGIVPCEWNGKKINVLDTPGYFDFVGEVKAALRVADAAAVVVCGVSGIQVGTELVWQYANENKLPKIVIVNKLNRENANFFKVVEQLRDEFGTSVAPLYVPIGKEDNFNGVLNILTNKAYEFSGNGREVKEIEAPSDLIDQMEEYRTQLIEAVVEQDDELMMLYLEGEEIPDADLISGLQSSVKAGSVVPVLAAAATKNIGIQPIMNSIVDLLPAPVANEDANGQPAALIFKTMADPYVGKINIFRVFSGGITADTQYYNVNKGNNERLGSIFLVCGKNQINVKELCVGDIGGVAKLNDTDTNDTLSVKGSDFIIDPIQFPDPIISRAVEADAKGAEEKIGTGLARLQEEDPTFTAERNTETSETVISGMGDMHLQVIKSRLADKFEVAVTLKAPRIPYRETVKKKVESMHKHKKQSGGKGQYGHVVIDLEPLHSEDKDYEFVDSIFGGSVPRQYIPAVDKGIQESLGEGPVAGYPVVKVKINLKDGSYHDVDSSEMAFKIAGSYAFKKGFLNASPILLEPIYDLEVTVPEEYMGDIMGDLNKKRGRIMGMEPSGRKQIIKAQVPLAEMSSYATDLRSMTQGRGLFKANFARYEEVPAMLAEKIIQESQKEE
ncbi:elongation factor G [Clostridium sp. 'deep sea']|uniref:elongation factor G n=1 Tax=Clostridium sp. 'deep sea' TaxID=2779445 RepID=UPI0018964DF9|nr:elongation factor G [Clostridium sp. 'deep sea']QOR34539.1 elongation factor G [Clostridium sp. 'deep sea']